MLTVLSIAALPILLLEYLIIPTRADDAPLKASTPQGCFSSAGTLKDQGSWTFQSSGYCQQVCVKLNFPVMAMANGTNCFCGDSLPPQSAKVSDDNCYQSCAGYPSEKCGAPNAFTVYLDGLSIAAAAAANAVAAPSSVTSPPPQTTLSPTENGTPSVIKLQSTVYVTAPGSTSATIIYQTELAQPSGPNKIALAAGVVAGVVGLCALAGGLFLWLRSRKRKAVEEEHRRNTAMNNLVNGHEKGSTTVSLADSRLEPSVMFQRRQSDGSIADNQDYSRRILKVANPDDR